MSILLNPSYLTLLHAHRSLHLHQTQSTGIREEHDLGNRLVKQRDRKKTKICQIISVITHNKGRRSSVNLSGPLLPHPVIHAHRSLHLHQTQSTGIREEHDLGDRLVKQRDRKKTKICQKEERR